MTDTELAILIDRFMRRLHLSLRRKSVDFDTEKVGPRGGFILLTLDETGPISMNDLAERLVRDKSQITREVRSLERKGLIAREASQKDSRVSIISLTDAGEKTVLKLQRVLAQTIDDLLVPLSSVEKQMLVDHLKRTQLNNNDLND